MTNKPDLEGVLKKRLGRVSAPDGLWGRVQGEAAPARTRPLWTAWAGAAAAVLVVGTGWMIWENQKAPVSIEALAVNALASGPEHLTLHSSNATEVRKWVRANSGLDLPLPPQHSPLVEIVGANVIRDGPPVAEVSYQVGEDRFTLLVAKDSTGTRTYPRHEVRASEEFAGARVSSWSMRGQSYTLAWSAPGEFRVACLLCHGGSEPPLLN